MDIQMIGVLWLIGAFFLGLLNCFFGYRLFIVTVAIVGLLLGASLGYTLGAFVGSNIAGLIAAAVLGLIGAWASVSAYYAFIFVAGAFGFALFAAFKGLVKARNALVVRRQRPAPALGLAGPKTTQVDAARRLCLAERQFSRFQSLL